MTKYESFTTIDKAISIGSLYCATIELLTKCNWQCKHCFIPEHNNNGLSFSEIENILKQLREMGCFKIVFTGGEIFLRKDIMNIIEIARSLFFEVILFTNISLLTEEEIKELSNMYISQISCTVFSMNEKIHDEITGVKGSLKKVIKNAILIRKYGIPLEIKTILVNKDPFAYREILKFCQKYGIEYLITTNICSKTDRDMSPKKFELTIKQLEIAIPEIDKILKLPRKKIKLSDPICKSIQYSCFIDCEGFVYPCNNMLIKIGDLKNSSLKDIWYKSTLLKKIKSIKERDLKYCSKCEKRIHCDRCAGIIYLEEGDLLGKSSSYCIRASIRQKNSFIK